MKKQCGCERKNVGVRKLSRFDASDLLGAPFAVVLHDAVKEHYCEDCGEIVGHIIPRPRELTAVAAVLRACHSKKLNGQEIRFLRKSLSRKAKDFAADISISAEQLSRYENDKITITESYEKLLRAATCLGHIEITQTLGIKANHLLSMVIRSADCVTKPVSFDLNFSLRPKRPEFERENEECEAVWLRAS